MDKRRRRPEVIPPDEQRCTRNDGRSWRCFLPRSPGNIFCHKHHIAYLAKLSPRPRPPRTSRQTLQSRVFQPGQIWALSSSADNIPRRYARIATSTSPSSSAVHVTPLLPHPVLPEDLAGENSRPPACGTFRPSPKSKPSISIDASALVFRVADFEVVTWMGIPFYRIFPKKGEVWAVWSKGGGGDHTKVVEVVSDFSEEEGVTVAGLVEVEEEGREEGEVCYRRHLHEGFKLVQTFARREMGMFSHRIPVSRVEGDVQMWKVVRH